VGSKVDWDLRFGRVRRLVDGGIEALGYQDNRKANGALYVVLKTTKDKFPSDDDMGEVWWMRVKGRISSIKNGQITLDAELVEAFVPKT